MEFDVQRGIVSLGIWIVVLIVAAWFTMPQNATEFGKFCAPPALIAAIGYYLWPKMFPEQEPEEIPDKL